MSYQNVAYANPQDYNYARESTYYAEGGELVVLLHGLARGPSSMSSLEEAFKKDGYRVLNLDYPTSKHQMEKLTNDYLHQALLNNNAPAATKLHFVGHSMGGIIARHYIAKYKPDNLGRVVTLGTAHRGSELADSVNNFGLMRKIFGRALEQLAPDSEFMQNLSTEINYELGVIAGNFSLNPVTSLLMVPGSDDGTVSIESTKIRGMKEHVVIKSAHGFLPKNKEAIEYSLNFIKYGSFNPN